MLSLSVTRSAWSRRQNVRTNTYTQLPGSPAKISGKLLYSFEEASAIMFESIAHRPRVPDPGAFSGGNLGIIDVQIKIQVPDDPGVDKTITQLHPDVVLIDIDHSQGKGIETIRKLHGRQAKRGQSSWRLPARIPFQYRASCHEAGAMFFFKISCVEQDWLMKSLAAIQEQLR